MMVPFARLHSVLAAFVGLGVDAAGLRLSSELSVAADEATRDEVYRNMTIYVVSSNLHQAAYIDTNDILQRILRVDNATVDDRVVTTRMTEKSERVQPRRLRRKT